MTGNRSVIDNLVDDLQPVRPVAKTLNVQIATWFGLSALWVVLATGWLGPLRPGAWQQLLDHPRFLFESLLGIASILAVAVAGFRSFIPGGMSRLTGLVAVVLSGLWLANYLVGFISPALEPSMLGKRAHCYLETIVTAMPPVALAVFMQRRLYSLRPMASAASLGFAAGMMPALYMQVACMYAPGHIFAWHIVPGVLAVLPAMLLVFALSRLSPGVARAG